MSDTESGRKTKGNSLKENLSVYASDYCGKTSIDGLQYLTEGRTWYERVWWMFFIIISIGGCMYMIVEIYSKWLEAPVLVSFATRKTPIYQVPFPAVTICPKVKIDKAKSGCFNLTNYVHKKKKNLPITEDEEKYARYMHVICDEDLTTSKEEYIDVEDFYKYIEQCEPKRKARLLYHGTYFKYHFRDLFKPLITEEGLCYTFNRLRLDEIYRDGIVIPTKNRAEELPESSWTSETGYKKGVSVETYPRRALMAEMKNGLGIYLFEDKRNVDYQCDPVLQGYTVTLHIPSRFPGTRDDFFFLPINSALLAPIEGRITLTSEKVKAYSPQKRDCYFPSERQLKYFRDYTAKNCKLECLTDHFLKKCGCVKFFMPRNASTKVCGPASIQCTDEVEVDSRLHELNAKIHGEVLDSSFYEACDCLPGCNDITYSADAASLAVDHEKISEWLVGLQVLKPQYEDDPNLLTTFLMLYFKDDFIETTERSELYGPSDFLSNFGGILGLFTGFSMMSFLEIVYYLSLRLIGNDQLFGHWAGVRN